MRSLWLVVALSAGCGRVERRGDADADADTDTDTGTGGTDTATRTDSATDTGIVTCGGGLGAECVDSGECGAYGGGNLNCYLSTGGFGICAPSNQCMNYYYACSTDLICMQLNNGGFSPCVTAQERDVICACDVHDLFLPGICPEN